MREAVTTLNERFGCRLFVIALADTKRVYDGGKVGTWAATLDELAREMNVVIVVSAGNRAPRGGNRIEQAVTEYPRYLAEEANRLFEPAGAINVVTVGSLSHGNGLDGRLGEEFAVRPITAEGEPSPFTRAGPGVEGSIKPDFIDLGGTMVLDPLVQRLRDGRDVASAGLLTLHHRPVEQLITSGSGTSYAAPILAFKAAQILTRFPDASANLIRALLASSASIPEAAQLRLAPLGEDITRSVCGYGQVDLEKAAFSDDARVVLFAEDELPIDHFAIYELPIPALFQSTNGRRT
jgi:subtilisin family serine protease